MHTAIKSESLDPHRQLFAQKPNNNMRQTTTEAPTDITLNSPAYNQAETTSNEAKTKL